jgi:hypothetical protein
LIAIEKNGIQCELLHMFGQRQLVQVLLKVILFGIEHLILLVVEILATIQHLKLVLICEQVGD